MRNRNNNGMANSTIAKIRHFVLSMAIYPITRSYRFSKLHSVSPTRYHRRPEQIADGEAESHGFILMTVRSRPG